MSVESTKRVFTLEEIKQLNKKYRALTVKERVEELYKDFATTEVMLTSSFAATSAFLLRIFSKLISDQTLYFINT